MQEDTEVLELKAIYDDLWADAKTLVKDMKKSIYIYDYAALLTFAVALITFLNASPYYATLIAGQASIITIAVIAINITAVAFEILFGAILLKWFKRMQRKYARLIELENSWRKKDD